MYSSSGVLELFTTESVSVNSKSNHFLPRNHREAVVWGVLKLIDIVVSRGYIIPYIFSIFLSFGGF